MAAGELATGDTLYLADGGRADIVSVTREKLATPVDVYNVEVADFHTYFVAGAGVWVHNCGGRQGGVYALENEAGTVVRTGRTVDLAQRAIQLANDPVLGQFKFRPVFETNVYAQQRGLEQMLYDQYPGAQAANGGYNMIRGINLSNPNYETYMNAANNYLR